MRLSERLRLEFAGLVDVVACVVVAWAVGDAWIAIIIVVVVKATRTAVVLCTMWWRAGLRDWLRGATAESGPDAWLDEPPMSDETMPAIPSEWQPAAFGREHWTHRELVASVYRVEGEFVCSANRVWIEGAYPTFEEAAAQALRWASRTQAEENAD